MEGDPFDHFVALAAKSGPFLAAARAFRDEVRAEERRQQQGQRRQPLETPSAQRAEFQAAKMRERFGGDVVESDSGGTPELRRLWSALSPDMRDEYVCRVFMPPVLGGLFGGFGGAAGSESYDDGYDSEDSENYAFGSIPISEYPGCSRQDLEAQVKFIRPDMSIEMKDVLWCLSNGFEEVEPGVWSGRWHPALGDSGGGDDSGDDDGESYGEDGNASHHSEESDWSDWRGDFDGDTDQVMAREIMEKAGLGHYYDANEDPDNDNYFDGWYGDSTIRELEEMHLAMPSGYQRQLEQMSLQAVGTQVGWKSSAVHEVLFQQSMEWKSHGNRLFLQKQYAHANHTYNMALLNFPKTPRVMPREQLTLWVILLSNRSECMLRLKKYDKAHDAATKALELDSEHPKSLLRRAKATSFGLANKDKLTVLPKDQTEKLLEMIKRQIFIWTNEAKSNGESISCIVSNLAMSVLAAQVPTSLEELSELEVLGEDIMKKYGERLVKKTKGFVEQNLLEKCLDRRRMAIIDLRKFIALNCGATTEAKALLGQFGLSC